MYIYRSRWGVDAHGLSISSEQLDFARKRQVMNFFVFRFKSHFDFLFSIDYAGGKQNQKRHVALQRLS